MREHAEPVLSEAGVRVAWLGAERSFRKFPVA